MKKKLTASATCIVIIMSINVFSLSGQASFDLETGATARNCFKRETAR